MKNLAALLLLLGGTARATEQATWDAYVNTNRYKCPGPLDTLKTARTLTLGGKTYSHSGYKIEVQTPDADNKVILGVISAIKDVSPGTKENFAKAIEWFKQGNAELLVVNGDLALDEMDLEEVIDMLGATGLPVLIVLGNSESKGSWTRAYKDRETRYPNLVNGSLVRQIVADDVELWTLSGYHDRAFVHQGAGCLYKPEDVEAMQKILQPSGKAPLMLVMHGPPLGKGKDALDWIRDKKNVGDPLLNKLIEKREIPFGVFGHILEAGGAAVGKELSGRVKAGTPVDRLYLNTGSLSGDPWGMNDGTVSNGMAFLITLEGGKAKYDMKKFKPNVTME